ncbi:MAG: molybdate ABC transporter substrate-binding protein [Actinomycetota bacterium]|nr:molybdate ABC transporter substrate-binding protein [Actinomycetota bacterium]
MLRVTLGAYVCALLVAVGFPACSAEDDGVEVVEVFAAASLTDAFQEVAERFTADHPGVEVRFNFLASSDLVTQIIEGARADVFASADEANMDRVIDEGLATDSEVFVQNRLAIAVAAGNPHAISGLVDLEDPELGIALCNEECPAGRYAREVFDKAGVEVEADSQEADVRGVLTCVGLGEADAGIVYVTDLEADPDVEAVDIAPSENVVATYPIAVLEGAPREAEDFVTFLRSEVGDGIFEEYGFELP